MADINGDQSSVGITAGSSVGGPLLQLLMADSILPGSSPSYELCKVIYTYHPLGQKMAEAPINMAQSQSREITVQEAPDEVAMVFEEEWRRLNADANILNVMGLSRVYGLAVLVIGCDGVDASTPLDMTALAGKDIWFNVFDPLNTAGSLVLSQVPNSKEFNTPVTVRVSSTSYHPTRFQVLMNESPVYLEYTTSAFGFVGRSVYQRALFPLKSFIRSMIADDMIATKLGLLVAKQKPPGSVIEQAMAKIGAWKRNLLKQAQTGNVLTIDTDEEITTVDMTNVDGAGTYSRNNILKNVATAADMPAKLLENESMVEGFGEGTEDAKAVAGYVERIRMTMRPVYAWFDNLVQYRAWDVVFFQRMQQEHPDVYGPMTYEDAFSLWRRNFSAVWPSLLRESESEQIKVEETKLNAIIALLEALIPNLDPTNKALLIQQALKNVSENERMFEHEFDLDYDELLAHLTEMQERQQDMEDKTADNEGMVAAAKAEPKPKKVAAGSR